MEPLVAIVIPAFNAACYIGRTLASASAQTYRNIEVIVIDDGSTDQTAALVDQWIVQDSRIRMIHVANGGVARARNIGIEQACAPFIAFLDADDLWHPDKIRLQVKRFLDAETPIGGCYALHRAIDLDDNVSFYGAALSAEGYIFARHLVAHLVGNGSSLMVRREIAHGVGGFDPSYADRGIGGCEDLDFELKLAAKHCVGVVPYFLVGYRRYAGSMSSDSLRMARAMIATKRVHVAANPALPRLVQRYAMASSYEYSVWASLRARKISLFLASTAQLVSNDPARSWRFAGALLSRLLAMTRPPRLGTNGAYPNPIHFLQLPIGPAEQPNDTFTLRRFAHLAEVDGILWDQLYRNTPPSADNSAR